MYRGYWEGGHTGSCAAQQCDLRCRRDGGELD